MGNALGVAIIGNIFYDSLGPGQSQSQTSAHRTYPLAFGASLVDLIVLAIAVAALLQMRPRNRQP